MSDDTIVSDGGNTSGPAKPLFRVPFLSGRMPLSRMAKTSNTTTDSMSPEISTTSGTVSPEMLPDASPTLGEEVQNNVPSTVSEEMTPHIVSPEETHESIPSIPIKITQPLETIVESQPKPSAEIKQVVPTDARIILGFTMLEVMMKLQKDQDTFFVAKERAATGAVLKLIKERESISLSFMEPQEKMSFCLTFLTAAISRSSATLVETSFLMIQSNHSPESFIAGLISFKKDAWEKMRTGGLSDETSAILALAPLLALLSLQDIFSRKYRTNLIITSEKGDTSSTADDAQDVVRVGEDIWTVVRDQLKKLLPETTDSEIHDKESPINVLIKTAVDEIQKNGRFYGIEGGVRILISGNTINRKAIYNLLTDIQKRVAPVTSSPKVEKYTEAEMGSTFLANELNVPQSITGEFGIAAPVAETKNPEPENIMSAVDESNSDTVKTIFLDDAFVKMVKLVCKVSDTANIETCFRKYASLTMKDFSVALQKEESLIQSEVSSFINWAKNSYLKEKIPVLNDMTLLHVLTLVERGVSGSLARS